MKACKCGSYAINHHCHGRDGTDSDLCDVCYWRKRAEQPARCAPAEDGVCESLDCPNHKPAQQEPVAWLQIGLAPFHDGDVIARTIKPTKWNSEWWRFEPLYTTPQQAQRKPLTREQVKGLMTEAGYDTASPQQRADFINGIRHGEAAHNIKENT